MASIESYTTKKGRRWSVRYRKPTGGTTMKRGFLARRDAQAWADQNEVDKRTGSYIAPSAGRITVGALAPQWLARKRTLKPSSYAPLEAAWRVHVQGWERVASQQDHAA